MTDRPLDVDAILLTLRANSIPNAAGCWIWQRSFGTRGYGQAWVCGRRYPAHRAALAARLGRWLEPGEHALHRCDVRACCNPEHVTPGSQADNNADATSKWRTQRVSRTRVYVMLGEGMTKAAIARELGCDPRTIFRIARELPSG